MPYDGSSEMTLEDDTTGVLSPFVPQNNLSKNLGAFSPSFSFGLSFVEIQTIQPKHTQNNWFLLQTELKLPRHQGPSDTQRQHIASRFAIVCAYSKQNLVDTSWGTTTTQPKSKETFDNGSSSNFVFGTLEPSRAKDGSGKYR